MKVLIATLFVLGSLSAQAKSAPAPATVLADIQTAVGFAPQEMRGVYHFQVLEDGKVQRVDNKGQVIALAQLAPALVDGLRQSIAQIVDLGLEDKDLSRGCMDAPTVTVLVRNPVGDEDKLIKIAQRIQCISIPAKDETAKAVAEKIKALDHALNSLKNE